MHFTATMSTNGAPAPTITEGKLGEGADSTEKHVPAGIARIFLESRRGQLHRSESLIFHKHSRSHR